MLWEKRNRFLRRLLLSAAGGMVALAAGCGDQSAEISGIRVTAEEKEGYTLSGKDSAGAESIAAVYRDICDRAVETNTSGSLEVVRSVVNRLGENGYSAVDSENQVDMVCPERIRRFCGRVKAKEEAEAALIVVISAINFIKYEFTTKDGNVDVLRSYCLCKADGWETVSTKQYPAYSWVDSEEGYLFFEEYHMLGFDGPSGHTAVRIEPLDERCREFNRKYIRAAGYELNNLFLTDWNEDNFGELNFDDLYMILCQMEKEPYASVGFFEEGMTYEIPKAEFENTFQNFFQIDEQALRRYVVYHEDTETYQYRQRGMFDLTPTPNIPYPEVVSYEENQDGTIKLTVNAVWREKNLGKAFCHEVVVRPLENGGFQYVSNHVISSEDNVEFTWYTERLSDN